jgi:hypothetical protein
MFWFNVSLSVKNDLLALWNYYVRKPAERIHSRISKVRACNDSTLDGYRGEANPIPSMSTSQVCATTPPYNALESYLQGPKMRPRTLPKDIPTLKRRRYHISLQLNPALITNEAYMSIIQSCTSEQHSVRMICRRNNRRPPAS